MYPMQEAKVKNAPLQKNVKQKVCMYKAKNCLVVDKDGTYKQI